MKEVERQGWRGGARGGFEQKLEGSGGELQRCEEAPATKYE